MVKVTGNGVPGAVGQGCGSLLPGLEVPRINRAGEIRQRFGSGSQGELDGSGCLNAVAGCLEHLDEPLWISQFQLYNGKCFFVGDLKATWSRSPHLLFFIRKLCVSSLLVLCSFSGLASHLRCQHLRLYELMSAPIPL